MNSIKTLYKLMEVSSRDLEIPDAYQRKLNTERPPRSKPTCSPASSVAS